MHEISIVPYRGIFRTSLKFVDHKMFAYEKKCFNGIGHTIPATRICGLQQG